MKSNNFILTALGLIFIAMIITPILVIVFSDHISYLQWKNIIDILRFLLYSAVK